MNVIAIIGALASVVTLWALIRTFLMVRLHRLGLRKAGVARGAYLANEILYVGIHAVSFGVAIAATLWALK